MANVIILPIDFSNLSEAALPLAKRIASVLDAQIHCVYVVEQPHIYTAVDMATPVIIPAPEDIADSARAQLQKFIASHLPNTQTGAIASPPISNCRSPTGSTNVESHSSAGSSQASGATQRR
jgi:nucleotide-binding universal stress UspA family protein